MNNTKKENKKETVKIDLPEAMIEKLENLFKDVNSNIFKKILFTVYLINQGKYNNYKKKYEDFYELSSTHYKVYMSLNTKLSGILKTLIENNIIEKIGGYTTGKSYQKYKMVDRYIFNKNDKNIKTCFLTKEDGAYVGKYIADDYIVKYAVNKKSVMSVTKKKEVTEIPVENEVSQQVEEVNNIKEMLLLLNAQADDIKILKEENKKMKIAIEKLEKVITGQYINVKEITPSTALEVLENNYEIIEDDDLNRNILIEDDDEELEILIQAFKEQDEEEAKMKEEIKIDKYIVDTEYAYTPSTEIRTTKSLVESLADCDF